MLFAALRSVLAALCIRLVGVATISLGFVVFFVLALKAFSLL
jgi:hypothetical protein